MFIPGTHFYGMSPKTHFYGLAHQGASGVPAYVVIMLAVLALVAALAIASYRMRLGRSTT
jgi:hypothetical protein